ncbi:hypothetical protein [Psychrobacter sp. APC 3350]|uniref:hypothetical protein n=1 Tax=Psychrobacter sp. APC 3350 TaxID=3035195 RepID=UPI0025B437AD|nr:hypothetical protein [Psychrobacter sp. APC 3350]MDN3453486.1 hypothetical protein [Psychrobacter sp. APC 3350]
MKIPDLNDLIADLQTAKQIAIDDRNPNAIVTATVAQAKLLGMDKMRDVTPYGNKEPEPIADYSMLTDTELRQLIAIEKKVQVTRVIVDPVADTTENY